MTEQIPPIENNDENVFDQKEIIGENTGRESVVETEEVKEELVAKKKTEIEKIIEEVNAKKPTGAELLNETHVNIPEGFTRPKESFFSAKWRKIATLLGSVGTMVIPQKSEGKSAEDTLAKKNTIEMSSVKKSVERDPIDLKQYEQFGIRKAVLLETGDTTKHVLLISLEEYKSYGDVFTVLKKAGLTPASTQTMDDAVLKNEAIFKKWGSVMSLQQTVNKLGNTSYDVVRWDERSRSFIGESREVKVKGGNNIPTSQFDSDYDDYGFIVEVPASKTGTYQ